MAPDKDVLIDEIVQREWAFFQNVNNTGGPASCQSMPATFSAMRRAQYAAWSPEAVASWYDDLFTYERMGANPLSFKYGYMMESTHPDEFERIKDMLPEVSPEKRELIDRLVRIEMDWAEEFAEKYPRFSATGRPIHSSQDTAEKTSVETYAKGEFSTYSEETLRLLLETYEDALARGENLNVTTAAEQARAYGYESLDHAERTLAEGRMSGQGLDG